MTKRSACSEEAEGGDTPQAYQALSAAHATLVGMETITDVLLLKAVQAWCDECGGEQLLLPADEDGVPGGLCCTACDAAVFVMPMAEPRLPLRRTA